MTFHAWLGTEQGFSAELGWALARSAEQCWDDSSNGSWLMWLVERVVQQQELTRECVSIAIECVRSLLAHTADSTVHDVAATLDQWLAPELQQSDLLAQLDTALETAQANARAAEYSAGTAWCAARQEASRAARKTAREAGASRDEAGRAAERAQTTPAETAALEAQRQANIARLVVQCLRSALITARLSRIDAAVATNPDEWQQRLAARVARQAYVTLIYAGQVAEAAAKATGMSAAAASAASRAAAIQTRAQQAQVVRQFVTWEMVQPLIARATG